MFLPKANSACYYTGWAWGKRNDRNNSILLHIFYFCWLSLEECTTVFFIWIHQPIVFQHPIECCISNKMKAMTCIHLQMYTLEGFSTLIKYILLEWVITIKDLIQGVVSNVRLSKFLMLNVKIKKNSMSKFYFLMLKLKIKFQCQWQNFKANVKIIKGLMSNVKISRNPMSNVKIWLSGPWYLHEIP